MITIKKKFITITFLVLSILISYYIISFLNSLDLRQFFVFSILGTLCLALLLTIFKGRVNSAYLLIVYIFYYTLFVSMFFFFFWSWLGVNYSFYIKFFDILLFEDLYINFEFFFNNLTVLMLFVVILVSYCVSIFSIWYMYGDPNYLKFLSYISYFSFFMILLVASNNLILIFVGWEGIGIYSYLLINFWSTRLSANRSALKAIIFNKVGDCFLYLFLFLYWNIYKTFNIYSSNLLISLSSFQNNVVFNIPLNDFLVLSLSIAAIAKSAQLILHVWLADAMEGPTPVSALLHAATMVTAGAYILIKFNVFVSNSFSSQNLILWCGLLTNLVASLVAANQFDIKKIIAYSTASQIGIIFISCGILKFDSAMFHIFNHAFFKALLFILAGVVIHYCVNVQDLRNMKNVEEDKFFIYFCYLIASLALMGIPYFSAHYSKEAVLNGLIHNSYFFSNIIVLLVFVSVISTCLYVFKIMFFLFFSDFGLISENFLIKKINNNLRSFYIDGYATDISSFIKPSNKLLCHFVCLILLILSVSSGYVFNDIFLNSFFSFNEINHPLFLEPVYLLYLLEISLPLVLYLIFLTLIFNRYTDSLQSYIIFINKPNLLSIMCKKFLFNENYFFITKLFIATNSVCSLLVEKCLIEPFAALIALFLYKLECKIKKLWEIMNLDFFVYLLLLTVLNTWFFVNIGLTLYDLFTIILHVYACSVLHRFLVRWNIMKSDYYDFSKKGKK